MMSYCPKSVCIYFLCPVYTCVQLNSRHYSTPVLIISSKWFSVSDTWLWIPVYGLYTGQVRYLKTHLRFGQDTYPPLYLGSSFHFFLSIMHSRTSPIVWPVKSQDSQKVSFLEEPLEILCIWYECVCVYVCVCVCTIYVCVVKPRDPSEVTGCLKIREKC